MTSKKTPIFISSVTGTLGTGSRHNGQRLLNFPAELQFNFQYSIQYKVIIITA